MNCFNHHDQVAVAVCRHCGAAYVLIAPCLYQVRFLATAFVRVSSGYLMSVNGFAASKLVILDGFLSSPDFSFLGLGSVFLIFGGGGDFVNYSGYVFLGLWRTSFGSRTNDGPLDGEMANRLAI